jgi:hypothetical protein
MPDDMGGLRIKGDRSGWVRAVPTEKRNGKPWHVSPRPIGASNDTEALVTETETVTVQGLDDAGRSVQRQEKVAHQRWEYELLPGG